MKKVDGRKNNGGARKGAGAPKKEVSEKAREIMKKAIRVLYNRDNDEQAQIAFLKDFAQTTRGQQFVAEHLFGKAPQVIEQDTKLEVEGATIKFVSGTKDK